MRYVLWGLLWIGLLSCSLNPVDRTSQLCPACEAVTFGQRTEFPLLGYVQNSSSASAAEFIHVYLEGDGRPWLRGRWPAANPTSRDMISLQLMARDPNPSIYLNRPCYGYETLPASCSQELWTNARYSQVVVDALDSALTELAVRFPSKRWILVGHSGGGTLVMLIAQRRADVAAIVTLAANLDHKLWTRERGFLPLDQSLNPAEQPPLPPSVVRWHFAGGQDTQVAPAVTESAAAADPYARFSLQPEFDHSCCWLQLWPHVLQDLHAQLTGTK